MQAWPKKSLVETYARKFTVQGNTANVDAASLIGLAGGRLPRAGRIRRDLSLTVLPT